MDSNARFLIHRKQRYGYVDRQGNEVIPPQFRWANRFAEGLAAVQLRGKWGYIDAAGTFLIEPQFRLAGEFRSGRAVVQDKHREFFFIDRSGHAVLKRSGIEEGSAFINGLAQLRVSEKTIFIDQDGNEILTVDSGLCSGFHDDRSKVERDGLIGYINRSGDWIVPPTFSSGARFSEGLAAVAVNILWGYIDTTGRMAIEPRFECVGDFSEGLAFFQEGRWRGYLDRHGATRIPAEFTFGGDFSEGLAAVTIEGHVTLRSGAITPERKQGYIDSQGREVVPPVYDSASSFRNGLAYVIAYRRFEGYINQQGNFVWRETGKSSGASRPARRGHRR